MPTATAPPPLRQRRKRALARLAWATLAVLATVLVLGALAARLGLPSDRLPAGASRISLRWAAAAFAQCSRAAPRTDGSYWTPSAAQIAALEVQLPLMLERRERAGLPTPPPFQPYQRQYVGFVRAGVHLIYANYAPAGIDAPGWSLFERPIVMCDGGRAFWGIVYDPRSARFEAPEFNGNG